jgi:phosphoserine phosphatase
MIGDGISDLETKPDVDVMVGFGGIISREKVKAGADVWVQSFTESSILSLLSE